MMSKTEGDEVEVQTPSGRRTYQILALVTWHEENGSGSEG
jgi:transcription elongation GreA/GreB family factor